MAPLQPPDDETVFDRPDLLAQLPGGDLNTESILWYFYNSQFFDPNSNNTALMNQLATSNDFATLHSRRPFEARLAAFPAGLSFTCVSEPEPGVTTQPFIIQKQFKWVNGETGKTEVSVQGTYYTVGTRIMMAPSLGDIVKARMLATTRNLMELLDLSKNLSQFSPGAGHSYLPPSYEIPKAAATASRISSPTLAAADSQLASQAQTQTGQPTAEPTEPDAFSDALFLASLHNTEQYMDEFMDENPLQGEPGKFVFRETKAAVKAREKREADARQRKLEAAEKAAAARAEAQSTMVSAAATPKTGVGAVATPGEKDSASRKQSVAGVPKPLKRKKSKGIGTPVTPTTPKPNFPPT